MALPWLLVAVVTATWSNGWRSKVADTVRVLPFQTNHSEMHELEQLDQALRIAVAAAQEDPQAKHILIDLGVNGPHARSEQLVRPRLPAGSRRSSANEDLQSHSLGSQLQQELPARYYCAELDLCNTAEPEAKLADLAFSPRTNWMLLSQDAAWHMSQVCMPLLQHGKAWTSTSDLQACMLRSFPGVQLWHWAEDDADAQPPLPLSQSLQQSLCRSGTRECECRLDVASQQGRFFFRNLHEKAWELQQQQQQQSPPLTKQADRICDFRRIGRPPSQASRKPPVLYSAPGSGNTFVRTLLDAATGYYSGSLYLDATLIDSLPGEGHCNHVSVVKAHPNMHSVDDLLGQTPTLRRNCGPFDAFAIVIRDFYHAVFAEFQRRYVEVVQASNPRLALNHHVSTLQWKDWDADFRFIWQDYVMRKAKESVATWAQYERLRQLPNSTTLLVSYERLVNSAERASELRRLVSFVVGESAVDESRLECAFESSASGQVRRVKQESDLNLQGVFTPRLVCRVWQLIQPWAEPLGYGPLFDLECADGEPAPRRSEILDRFLSGTSTESDGKAKATASRNTQRRRGGDGPHYYRAGSARQNRLKL
ncbi:uncharacterized protein MONBRDRAFT_21847 [Monosiga brevicollis MX1]|uniref:Sulfotransferase domain-containing protein n=1 Tax=Monosiga brevicollis TaxID=81824 RepID=A9UNS7_MONBE|nr:uncharacterized protein MONBRDRAFT_21847 [Monosiga brevicollis MX1]EDQ92750.1 predicted protein [Monosiga brevicollis MX1]|eukprot:XP_001742512.1 hypothetical protein [Monosiga brevicollis MX1]